MPWIKAVDKYPDGFKIARMIGDDKSMPVMFAPYVIAGADGKTYKKEELEYFDTTEPSFTIEDMKAACLAGANWGDGTIDEKPADWFKRVYNIDITKQ